MQQNSGAVQLSLREGHWISEPFLVVPIQMFLITYNLRRAVMAIWVVGCLATLFQK